MSPIQSNTQQGTVLKPCATDLSASKGCFAMIDATANIVLPAAGGLALFVITDVFSVAVTEAGTGTYQAEVMPLTSGRNVRVIAGVNGVTAGDKVVTLATGKAVRATAGNTVLGIAEETGVAGQYVLIRPYTGPVA